MARKTVTEKTPAHATIIGLGGIGSWLVQTAAPLMAFDERHEWTLTLVDGDKYTASNISRQAFDPREAGEYKADVQARWVMRRFPNIRTFPVPEYLQADFEGRVVNLPYFEGSIILLAVDNHKSRKLASDLCGKLRDVTLISGGNEMTDGNVQVYIRKAGVDITPPLGKYHPEIASPQDKAPFELSCEELSRSEPQILATNLMVASCMLNEFCRLSGILNRPDHRESIALHSEIYVDVLQNVSTRRERR